MGRRRDQIDIMRAQLLQPQHDAAKLLRIDGSSLDGSGDIYILAENAGHVAARKEYCSAAVDARNGRLLIEMPRGSCDESGLIRVSLPYSARSADAAYAGGQRPVCAAGKRTERTAFIAAFSHPAQPPFPLLLPLR